MGKGKSNTEKDDSNSGEMERTAGWSRQTGSRRQILHPRWHLRMRE
jgi:hypothetical protein